MYLILLKRDDYFRKIVIPLILLLIVNWNKVLGDVFSGLKKEGLEK